MKVWIEAIDKDSTVVAVVFKVEFEDTNIPTIYPRSYVNYADINVGDTSKDVIDKAWNDVKDTVSSYMFWCSQLDFTGLAGNEYVPTA